MEFVFLDTLGSCAWCAIYDVSFILWSVCFVWLVVLSPVHGNCYLLNHYDYFEYWWRWKKSSFNVHGVIQVFVWFCLLAFHEHWTVVLCCRLGPKSKGKAWSGLSITCAAKLVTSVASYEKRLLIMCLIGEFNLKLPLIVKHCATWG